MSQSEPLPTDRGRPTKNLFLVLRDTTFRSLRHQNYRLYFFGQIVSFSGTWMQQAAMMWLVWTLTNDAAWPARLLVCAVGPTLLLGPWGGSLADRPGKLALLMRTQTAMLVTAVTLTLLVAFNLVTPWVLVAVQLTNGIIQAIDLPMRLAFVPTLIPKDDLINAVSLNSLVFNSARAVGPAMAGGVFLLTKKLNTYGVLESVDSTKAGIVLCFALNAMSFLAVLVALRAIQTSGTLAKPTTKPRAGGILDGFKYVANQPVLLALLGLTIGVCSFGWPALSLFPAYTGQVLGLEEKEYSVLVSGLGSGALLGALSTATFGTIGRRGLLLTLGAGMACLGLFGLAVAPLLTVAVVVAGLLGFGLVLFLSTAQSTLQLSVADEMRGRVMSLWAMTLSVSAPLGHLCAGELANSRGVTVVILGLAVGMASFAAMAAFLTLTVGWTPKQHRPKEADQ